MLAGVHTQRRELGLGSAIAVVTGESIALGIFLTPATMAKSLGSPLLLGLVWCGMGLMALCGALCYSELAVRFPQSGGEYIYLREGFGKGAAFLYGWMSSVVMYPGLAAALSVGAAAYLTALLPMGRHIAACVPALLLLAFAAVNLLGTRLSGRMMTGLNLLKLVVLFALVSWVFLSGHAHIANLRPLTQRSAESEALFPALAGAIVSAFFSFGGWWEAGKIAGEIRNPKRNLPIAFVGGVLLVTAVYLLISFAFLAVLPISTTTSSIAFVSQFGGALFGRVGATVLSCCALVCVCGGLAALTMAAPRVSYAMAQAGQFLSPFGRLHTRFGTPANAILLQTGLSLAALLLGTFDRILAYIIFSAVVFLALTAATLFRLPQRSREWYFPGAPILFIACSAVIALLILFHNPFPALLGICIVLSGELLRRVFLRQGQSTTSLTTERT
jgi:APA family basic amino acid/polyamine antiporter